MLDEVMSRDEMMEKAKIALEKKLETSDVRKELKLAYLEFHLDDGQLYVTLEKQLHTAYLACLVAGMSHEEISGLQQHWMQLLYAGHFRRTK